MWGLRIANCGLRIRTPHASAEPGPALACGVRIRNPQFAISLTILSRMTAAVLAMALLAAPAVADVVAAAGKPPAVGVAITGLRDGELFYRLPAGREISRPIEQIEYLQVTGWPSFNIAEKQQRERQLRQAALEYEKLLSESVEARPAAKSGTGQTGAQATAEGPLELNRQLLVQCRLLRVYDADYRFDRAVQMYIDIISSSGGQIFLDRLRPVHVPAPDSQFIISARASVDAAVQRHRGDTVGAALTKWRESWSPVRMSESQPAAAPARLAPRASSRPSGDERGSDSALAPIRTAVEAGRFGSALQQIEKRRQEAAEPADSLRAELFYWQGRALLLKASSEKGEDAAADLNRAGLAFMRVSLQFPGSTYAAESLYRAGELCERSDQREQASALWLELVSAYPNVSPWADKARDALDKRRTGNASK